MFSSFDIARFSDVVYSEVLSLDQFSKLDLTDPYLIVKNDDLIFYKQKNFVIKGGDIIFTHTGNLDNLFYHLKTLDEKFQLTLITHQSDTMINKNLYKKKPKCIDNWFALNVDYKNESLIPIPLGIANEHWHKKNITSKNNLSKFDISIFKKEDIKVYFNFNESTNREERGWIKNYFNDFSWAEIEKEELNINEFSEKIKNATFVICPWGNGVDTHRLWEALSLGSIPIVKKHVTHKNLDDLPIMFVDDYKQVNEKSLKSFLVKLNNSNNFNLEKLESTFWENLIKGSQNKPNIEKIIKEKKLIFIYYKIKTYTKSWFKSKMKIFKFYLIKIQSLFKSNLGNSYGTN